MLRWIMHVDMDAFFASVEVIDHPELSGLPVIVGGQSLRGVVSTCSYEARKFGVHSAMPMSLAHKLCPQGVFLSGRMDRYHQVSKKIMQIFYEISPQVEQLSIDEAFLDITGMDRLYGSPEQAAYLAKKRIKDEIGITASIGLAPNKFLAKMASDLQKPNGFTIIKHQEARKFIAPLPVTKIFGIGKNANQKLLQFGIETIGQLALTDDAILQRIFGKNFLVIKQLALGIDNRPVIAHNEAKSIGKEITFTKDLNSIKECKEKLLFLSGLVGYRLRSKGYNGKTLTLKIKYNDFSTITRSITSESNINSDENIYELAILLLKSVNLKGYVRLLGITISGLDKGENLGLLFLEDERQQKRNQATDALKAKFGEEIIFRGGRYG